MHSRNTIIVSAAAFALLGVGAWFWWPGAEAPATGAAEVAQGNTGSAGPGPGAAQPGPDSGPPPIASLPGDEAFRVAMTRLEVMGAQSREAQRYIMERGREAVPDLLAELRAIRARQAQLPVPAAKDRGVDSEYYRLEIRKFQIVALLGEVAGPDVAPDLVEVSRSSLPDSLVHQYVSLALRKIGNWPAARQFANQILADPASSSVKVRQALSVHLLDPEPAAAAEAVRRAGDRDPMLQDLALRVAARAGKREVLPQIMTTLETPHRDGRDLGALMALAELQQPVAFDRDLDAMRKRDFVSRHLREAQEYNQFKWSAEDTQAKMAPELLHASDANLIVEGLRFYLERGSQTELMQQGIVIRVDALTGKPTPDGAVLVVSPKWKSMVAISGYGVSTADGNVSTRKL